MRILESPAREEAETQPADAAPVALAEAQNVGALLREARERRGISLDRLAQTTRIRASFLRAIESNQFDAMPQAIFLRGFLRAYAREVGLDPEETVRQYMDQFKPAETPVENPTIAGENVLPRVEPQFNWRAFRNLAGVVAIAGVLIAYGHSRPQPQAAAPAPAPAPAPVNPAPQARPEIGTAGSATPAPVPATGRVLRVAFRTTGDCWVSAKVDGAQVVYKLLTAGDERTFEVKNEAVLHFGDPATVRLSIDGAAGRQLGAAGQPVTVHITKDNFRDFLQK